MSIFTHISQSELNALLTHYVIGQLRHCTGIAEGVTNSNFYLSTTTGDYVLTIFEQLTTDQLIFFINLTQHLAEQGLTCPQPIADKTGRFCHQYNNKPLLINSRLPGQTANHPTPAHCAQVGEALAMLHGSGQAFSQQIANPRDKEWHQQTAESLYPLLEPADRELLQQEIYFQSQQNYSRLPRGIIHADLFPDNVLFDGRITSLIDFYYACYDTLLFDVAVTVNAWCADQDGQLHPTRLQALLQAYQQRRPFTQHEHALWPALRRAAALRFWLSRLSDFHFTPAGEQVLIKEPLEFKRILLAAID